METLAWIAEQRIMEALQRGEFDHLPNMGKPLILDDDSLVAPELRMAYRILKNAGCLPQEVMIRKEIAAAEELLASLPAGGDTVERTRRRLHFLRTKLWACRGRKVSVLLEDH
jgi:hypothetical protein